MKIRCSVRPGINWRSKAHILFAGTPEKAVQFVSLCHRFYMFLLKKESMGNSGSVATIKEKAIVMPETPVARPSPYSLKPGEEISVNGICVRIIKHLGDGVYGSVFLAEEKDSGARRALKFIKSRGSDSRSIRAEKTVYSSLESRCQKLGPGQAKQLPCMIAQETFKDGSAMLLTDLAPGVKGSRAFTGPRLDLSEMGFIKMLIMAVQPLVAIHAENVTHGDLKPENMVLDFDPVSGDCVSLMLVDYGLACNLHELETDNRDTCISQYRKIPHYMDPTYVSGVANLFQADMYSVGRYVRFFAEKQRVHLSGAVVKYLLDLCERLTSKEALRRPTAEQTLAALQRIAHAPGDMLTVNGIAVVVADRGYISRKLSRCVLSVTTEQESEPTVVKLLFRTGRHKERADRETYSLERLHKNEGVPRLLGSELDRKRKEQRLLVTAPGGQLGMDLSEMLEEQGIPTGDSQRERREHIMLAMAKAVLCMHAQPGQTALLDCSISNFRVAPRDEGLIPVDFGSSCSPDMQRDRPDLTERATFNVFSQDVQNLAAVWLEIFPTDLEKDTLIARMLHRSPNKRPTLARAVLELESRLGL